MLVIMFLVQVQLPSRARLQRILPQVVRRIAVLQLLVLHVLGNLVHHDCLYGRRIFQEIVVLEVLQFQCRQFLIQHLFSFVVDF